MRMAKNSAAVGLLTAVTYGAIAVAATFVNKYATQVLPYPDFLLLLQLAGMLVVVTASKALGWVDFPDLTLARFRALLPLAVTYSAHAAMVLRALSTLNIPMYNTLKRTTPMMVLVAKIFIDKKLPDLQVALSVITVVAGCIVAGAGDLAFDLHGYSAALLCALLQAAYILLAEYVKLPSEQGASSSAGASGNSSVAVAATSSSSEASGSSSNSSGSSSGSGVTAADLADRMLSGSGLQHVTATGAAGVATTTLVPELQGLKCAGPQGTKPSSVADPIKKGLSSAFEIMHCASIIAVPVALLVVVTSGQHDQVLQLIVQQWGKQGPAWTSVTLGVTAVMELLLTGSLIVCTQTNSALTTTVVGVLKGIVVVVLGFFLLGGVQFSWLNVSGITINTLGGVWYGAAKYREAAAAQAKHKG